MNWKITPAKAPLKGDIKVPADKSVSHRAVMFGSISRGKCTVSNFLSGEDCLRTVEAFRSMGIDITANGDDLVIEGKGLKGLKAPGRDIYMGNSGTSMRIIPGVLAAQDFTVKLTGDASLSTRPMKRVMEPLARMGAEIGSMDGHAPLVVKGRGRTLEAIHYDLPVASAQVKSCVLAAGLYADGVTSVTEPFPSRDHTERMLLYLSADITTAGLTTRITGLKELEPKHIDVPGDISSAAFWIVAATIVEGSRVILRDVGLNPTRRGIIDVITRMGGNIKVLDLKEGVEPRADIEVRYARLKGTVVEENEIPLLIDEIPVLSVAAALAEGKTVIKGIKELKVKETDRVKGMVEALSALGASAAEEGDKLVIYGDTTFFKPANLKSRGDHRMAMSGSVAALVSEGVSTVSDTACVETSYPGFLSDMGRIAGSVYSIHP